jgi:hypothetical protein
MDKPLISHHNEKKNLKINLFFELLNPLIFPNRTFVVKVIVLILKRMKKNRNDMVNSIKHV